MTGQSQTTTPDDSQNVLRVADRICDRLFQLEERLEGSLAKLEELTSRQQTLEMAFRLLLDLASVRLLQNDILTEVDKWTVAQRWQQPGGLTEQEIERGLERAERC